MKTMIIDDDPMFAEYIEEMLARCPGVELIGSYRNPLEGLEKLKEIKPDSVFLDVKMEGLDGIQVSQMIPETVKIILISSYTEFAVKAFEIEAVDYLVKPFSFDRLYKAVLRLKLQLNKTLKNDEAEHLEETQTIFENDNFFVKSGHQFIRLNLTDVLYVESQKEYCKIVSKKGSFLILSSLTNIQNELDKKGFVRVHKSYLINLKNTNLISSTHAVIEEHQIPIGRSYKDGIFEYINSHQLLGGDHPV